MRKYMQASGELKIFNKKKLAGSPNFNFMNHDALIHSSHLLEKAHLHFCAIIVR
jgi:hypothetical protein